MASWIDDDDEAEALSAMTPAQRERYMAVKAEIAEHEAATAKDKAHQHRATVRMLGDQATIDVHNALRPPPEPSRPPTRQEKRAAAVAELHSAVKATVFNQGQGEPAKKSRAVEEDAPAPTTTRRDAKRAAAEELFEGFTGRKSRRW